MIWFAAKPTHAVSHDTAHKCEACTARHEITQVPGCVEEAKDTRDGTTMHCRRRSKGVPDNLLRFTSGFRASTSALVMFLLEMMSVIDSPARTGYVL